MRRKKRRRRSPNWHGEKIVWQDILGKETSLICGETHRINIIERAGSKSRFGITFLAAIRDVKGSFSIKKFGWQTGKTDATCFSEQYGRTQSRRMRVIILLRTRGGGREGRYLEAVIFNLARCCIKIVFGEQWNARTIRPYFGCNIYPGISILTRWCLTGLAREIAYAIRSINGY